jgi:hypothetical protein
LIKMCTEEGLVIGPKATCATMKLLLRDFLEAQVSGSTLINFGKYDGHTYDELKRKQPGYLAWAIKTAAETKDCSRALQTLASWGARHQEKTSPKLGKSSTTPSQKPKESRQREDPEEEAKMDAEPPEETLEAIQELETRLAILRQKNGIRAPGTSSSGASSWHMATSIPGLGESILAGAHSEVEDDPEENGKQRNKATKARPLRIRKP